MLGRNWALVNCSQISDLEAHYYPPAYDFMAEKCTKISKL
jgi:hypothetical protein